MNGIRRLAALLAALCMLIVCASAEPAVLPDLDLSQPLQVSVRVAVDQMVPLDDVRTGWLNDLLSYHELRLLLMESCGATSTGMTILVDSSEVLELTLAERNGVSSLTTSLLPGMTFTASAGETNALDLLTGSDPLADAGTLFPGLDALSLADDAEAMLMTLQNDHADSLTVRRNKETVNGYGSTVQTKTLLFKSAEAAGFGEILLACCPEGTLRQYIAGAELTGTQTLTMLTEEDGTIHKVTWTGSVLKDGDKCSVSLTWRFCRTDELVRDDLTLKTSGSQRSGNVTYKRKIQSVKGVMTDELSFNHTETVKGKKSAFEAEWTLTSQESDEAKQVTGTAHVTVTEPGESQERYDLTPDFLLQADGAAEGTVHVIRKLKDVAQNDLTFRLAMKRIVPPFTATAETQTVDLNTVSEEELQMLRDTFTAKAATQFLCRWVLLPHEATLYLSQDLSEEAWQAICYAALSLTE